ncbi:neuropeptide Y receptor type 2-like [Montipora capricornis]|uniref:neuropeptide Y receptor type 2-like n=1 Tax=Montipora capricornis TaxID=246305 RepID=UPI0035F19534
MNLADGSTSNLTSNGIPDGGLEIVYYKETLGFEIFRLTFQVFLAFVGVAGNIIVCFVISSQVHMRTITNYFIRNLAVADIGVLLLAFPSAVINEQAPDHWPLGRFTCLYVLPLCDVFPGVSVWSITLIAFDRYRAIVRGALPKRGSTVFKSARWIVACVWLLSFLVISLPLYLVMEFTDHKPAYDVVECFPKWPNNEEGYKMKQSYTIGLTIFWYVLPLGIIAATFCSISQKLRASSKFNRLIRKECSDGGEQKFQKRVRERQNTKAKKLLIPVVVVFAVTMLPVNVFRLTVLYWEEIYEHKYIWVYYNTCVLCVVANSSANFFIYSLVSEEFRQSFKRFFSRNMGAPSSQGGTERTVRSPLSPMDLKTLSSLPSKKRSGGDDQNVNNNQNKL